MNRGLLWAAAMVAGASCSARAPSPPASATGTDGPTAQASVFRPTAGPTPEGKEERAKLPPVPCPISDRQDVDAALDEAARRFERSDFAVALACADQASRAAPRSVEAHHD